ncbi:MAG: tRNA adenosine(34) deaminase TadA [Nitrospinota bacterium]
MPDLDLSWMRRALELAEEAAQADEVPVGAVVVLGDRILGEARNGVEQSGDPTAHAEILAVRRAAESYGYSRLAGSVLYSTLEPCAMCAGAILLARVGRLVFAARDPKGGCCGSLYDLVRDRRFNHRVEVEEGLLAEESAALVKKFFRTRRKAATGGR